MVLCSLEENGNKRKTLGFNSFKSCKLFSNSKFCTEPPKPASHMASYCVAQMSSSREIKCRSSTATTTWRHCCLTETTWQPSDSFDPASSEKKDAVNPNARGGKKANYNSNNGPVQHENSPLAIK